MCHFHVFFIFIIIIIFIILIPLFLNVEVFYTTNAIDTRVNASSSDKIQFLHIFIIADGVHVVHHSSSMQCF